MMQKIEILQDRDILQTELLEIYQAFLLYYNLSKSAKIFSSDFILENKIFSYLEIIKKKDFLIKKLKKTQNKQEIILLVQKIEEISKEKSKIFKIIAKNGNFFTPNEIWSKKDVFDQNFFYLWRNLAKNYHNNKKWNFYSREIIKKTNFNHKKAIIITEFLYNKLDFLQKTIIFYFISLFFAILALFFSKKRIFLKKISFLTIFAGLFCHISLLIMRMIITARPPITSLYESIIFVSFIIVLLSFFLEYKNKNGLIVGSMLGFILQFIAQKYQLISGDINVVVAVLNNNFWLSAHILSVTIGYALSLIAGSLAHIYLIKEILNKPQKDLINHIFIISIIALFWTMTGTILGGIWADQSWGRFWGWDPKENGAMLIILWLILLIHSKITNFCSDKTFTMLMVGLNIIVILSWYGVNLLNVGLHSYGFTQNIATNIAIFIAIEILFILFAWSKLKFQ